MIFMVSASEPSGRNGFVIFFDSALSAAIDLGVDFEDHDAGDGFTHYAVGDDIVAWGKYLRFGERVEIN